MPKFKANGRNIAIGCALAAIAALVISDLANNDSPSATSTGGGSIAAVPRSVDDATTTTTPADPGSSPTVPSSAATTTAAGNDDGDDGVGSLPPATSTPDPAATEAATAFTAAWLNTTKTDAEWRAGVLPRVTEDVAAELEYADPGKVPAGGRVGEVKTSLLDGQLTVADVQVVTDGGPKATLGTVHLSLVHRGRTWLISEIDWDGKK